MGPSDSSGALEELPGREVRTESSCSMTCVGGREKRGLGRKSEMVNSRLEVLPFCYIYSSMAISNIYILDRKKKTT